MYLIKILLILNLSFKEAFVFLYLLDFRIDNLLPLDYDEIVKPNDYIYFDRSFELAEVPYFLIKMEGSYK